MPLRTTVHTSWLLAGGVLGIVGWLWPLHRDLAFVLDLSIGIFGGLIAAITFALALTIQQEQAWPSARAVVRDSGALAWLAISVASLTLAISAQVVPVSVVGRAGTACLWLAVLSLLIGIWNVGSILSAAGGPGRRQARVRILREDLETSARSAGGRVRRAAWREDTLDDFVVSFRRAVEAEDLAAIRGHTDEVVSASAGLGLAEQSAVVTTHLRMASILGSELVLGGPPLAASAAFQDLLEGAVDSAGRTLDSQRDRESHDSGAERRAVVTLGETTRLAAFFAKAVGQRYHESSSSGTNAVEDEYAARIMLTCHDVRTRIRFAVDPDPPEKLLRAEDPWREGVSDPDSILLWLWANTDFDGTNQGSALYSVHEVFLNAKYFGTVFGDTSVVSDLRHEVMSAAPARTVSALEARGGFDRIFLEVCANSLAQLKPYAWAPPPQLADNSYYIVDPRSRLRQFSSLKTPDSERPRSVDRAVEDLLFLLGPSAGKFSTFALSQYRASSLGTLRPGREVASRPPAAVLATALTLMSSTDLDAAAQVGRLKDFFTRIPQRLLSETSAFGGRVLQPSTLPSSAEDDDVLIDQLSTVWGR